MTRRPKSRVVLYPLLLAVVSAVLIWFPASGSAGSAHVAKLSTGAISAAFDADLKETTYSVPNVVDDNVGATCCQYAWTLTISAPAGQVDPAYPVDPACDNHGVSGGTGTTFTWQHSNAGDSPRDDHCNHDIYGKFGHQGLISVVVSDDKGWQCSATYKGTNSSEANTAAGFDAASAPNCGGPTVEPPPPPPPPPPAPCKCSKVKAFLNNFHVFGAGTTRIEFDVKWQITCTAGAGLGCKGRVNVLAPRGANFLEQGGKTVRPEKPTIIRVDCAGKCNKTTEGKDTVQYVSIQTIVDTKGKKHSVQNPGFTPEGRAGKTFKIKLGLICISPTGVPGFPVTKTLKLKFDRLGQVDYKGSDLDGDGRNDGGQLKRF